MGRERLWSWSVVGSLGVVSAGCGSSEGARATADESASGSISATAGETATDGGSGQSDTQDSAASGTSASDSASDGDAKFDLGVFPDAGTDCGSDGGGATMFSYIWIANSSEGTVSKINTQSGVEEGRYYTNPSQGTGNPSRTSVNLVGDVAVSNREPGGVTKIAAEQSRCDDRNNDGVIQTSTGPGDILPWMDDECVLWHLSLPTTQYNYGTRPTAWEGGDVDENGCLLDNNPRLWVGYKDEVTQHGIFLRVDGGSGAILDTVDGPVWAGISAMGPYGGAVNAAGDFIVTGLNYGNVIRIDADTLQLTEIVSEPQDKYGMGLDADGNIWVGGFQGNVHHYDFATDTWTAIGNTGGTRVNGIMVDRDGYAWGAGSSPCRLVQIDTATKTIVNNAIPLPGCSSPWGISIDVDGFVWVVDMGASRAFKVNPQTYAVELEVTGLVSPYTYSDMTGAGLNLVVNPPG